jgi:hypothetical protein
MLLVRRALLSHSLQLGIMLFCDSRPEKGVLFFPRLRDILLFQVPFDIANSGRCAAGVISFVARSLAWTCKKKKKKLLNSWMG